MIDYALMNQYLYEGNASKVEQMTKDALAEGKAVQEVLNDGLIAGMSVVGEDFKHNILSFIAAHLSICMTSCIRYH